MVKATISQATWGRWPSLTLSTPALEVEVVAGIGARVVSLRDLGRDREWLMPGRPPSGPEQQDWSAEGVVFGGRESFGWDECLPTVSVCPDPHQPKGPPLRDHGDQWGREASLSIDAARGCVEHTWNAPRWDYWLSRRLSFPDEHTLLAEYELASQAREPLPLLWSQHAVLGLEPGCHVDLPGVAGVSRTVQLGIELPEAPDWPRTSSDDGREVDFARVTTGAGWAAKLYASAPGEVAAVAPDGARLAFDWDREFAPVLGVWLAYGGWQPEGEPCEQVALEPTTSADDHLEAALAHGRARMLGPGERVRWWVRMRVS